MSDMKCPFCQQELEIVFEQAGHNLEEAYLLCNKCNLRAERKVWQELIRTRKALDIAKDTIRHADWFFDGDYNVDAKTMHNEIKCAIKAITALNKESAFVHNKIKFPEYNDNLLEEFDKQFFENGQDDDLTETALEQKDK